MPPRSQYYGRRSARRLTGGRIDILKRSLARYEIALPPEGARLPAPEVPLWLEIGFGGGEHLLELARLHPETAFIGCEPFLNGVATLIRQLDAEGIANVRIFAEDARLLLRALPPASVARAFVLFADPWPKLRHHRRRMISPETLDQFARVLTPEGNIHLATDHPDLARWYGETVAAHPAFTLLPATGNDPAERPAGWPETRYERKAIAAGRRPVYFIVERVRQGQA